MKIFVFIDSINKKNLEICWKVYTNKIQYDIISLIKRGMEKTSIQRSIWNMQKLESLEAVHTGDLINKKNKYNQGKIVSIFKLKMDTVFLCVIIKR